jgi:hypothetical protein
MMAKANTQRLHCWDVAPGASVGYTNAMADEDKVLDFLRERFNRLDARLDGMARDLHEVRVVQAAMAQTLAAMQTILASHDARLLRVDERLDRIERRLDLVETPAAG